MAALFVVLLALPDHAASGSLCDGFNDGVDGSSYWEQVANCTACAGTPSCGFCLSTLLCSAGDSHGASDGADLLPPLRSQWLGSLGCEPGSGLCQWPPLTALFLAVT